MVDATWLRWERHYRMQLEQEGEETGIPYEVSECPEDPHALNLNDWDWREEMSRLEYTAGM